MWYYVVLWTLWPTGWLGGYLSVCLCVSLSDLYIKSVRLSVRPVSTAQYYIVLLHYSELYSTVEYY